MDNGETRSTEVRAEIRWGPSRGERYKTNTKSNESGPNKYQGEHGFSQSTLSWMGVEVNDEK
jgi:hypothetical protein